MSGCDWQKKKFSVSLPGFADRKGRQKCPKCDSWLNEKFVYGTGYREIFQKCSVCDYHKEFKEAYKK